MYKRLLKIIIAHLSVILYWGFLYKIDIIVEEAYIFGGISLLLFITLWLVIYTELSNNKLENEHTNFALICSIVPLGLILNKNRKTKILLFYLSIISTTLYVKNFMNFDKAKRINILPVSRKPAEVILTVGIIVIILVVYLFEIDIYILNIFLNLVFLLLESFFVLFIKDKEDTYEKTYRLYYLSDYMANERDEFARIIHDDIIQDIFASKNYLSLKDPDLEYIKNILTKLEDKSRGIMKFYQSNLFERGSLETSILAIFDNISSLYPNKNINIEKMIENDLIETEDEEVIRIISIISKELINNIYKHSDATYLKYKLYKKEGHGIIEIESDGASLEDFQNIKDSKRGVLLLNLLVDSNSGDITYELDGDILSTKVELEVEGNEDYFIR